MVVNVKTYGLAANVIKLNTVPGCIAHTLSM